MTDPMFPRINTLDDVVPYIKDNSQFTVMDRGPFTIVDYHFQAPGSFDGPDAKILRECRGLIFDTTSKKILGRRFHKFFNVNEKPETHIGTLPFDDSTLVMSKLDGSMISPVAVDGNFNNIRWTTRKGITTKAMEAEAFVARNPVYAKFARELLVQGWNPIFEYVGPSNRIVVDYKEESLILLAVRDIVWGDYMMHAAVSDYGKEFSIPVVPTFPASIGASPEKHVEGWRQETDREGYVLRFFDGSMVKIKNEWYVRLHRTKETLDNPRLLVQSILEQKTDDLISLVPDADAAIITQRETEFWGVLRAMMDSVQSDFNHYHSAFSRKDFALGPAKNLPVPRMRAIFAAWDGDITVQESLARQISTLAYRSDKAFVEGMKLIFGKAMPKWME